MTREVLHVGRLPLAFIMAGELVAVAEHDLPDERLEAVTVLDEIIRQLLEQLRV